MSKEEKIQSFSGIIMNLSEKEVDKLFSLVEQLQKKIMISLSLPPLPGGTGIGRGRGYPATCPQAVIFAPGSTQGAGR